MIHPDIFPPGSTHSTFASNPMGTAVALETLKCWMRKILDRRSWRMGAYFLDGLKQLQRRHRVIGDVDGLGLALRAEVCQEDGYTPDKATARLDVRRGHER